MYGALPRAGALRNLPQRSCSRRSFSICTSSPQALPNSERSRITSTRWCCPDLLDLCICTPTALETLIFELCADSQVISAYVDRFGLDGKVDEFLAPLDAGTHAPTMEFVPCDARGSGRRNRAVTQHAAWDIAANSTARRGTEFEFEFGRASPSASSATNGHVHDVLRQSLGSMVAAVGRLERMGTVPGSARPGAGTGPGACGRS